MCGFSSVLPFFPLSLSRRAKLLTPSLSPLHPIQSKRRRQVSGWLPRELMNRNQRLNLKDRLADEPEPEQPSYCVCLDREESQFLACSSCPAPAPLLVTIRTS